MNFGKGVEVCLSCGEGGRGKGQIWWRGSVSPPKTRERRGQGSWDPPPHRWRSPPTLRGGLWGAEPESISHPWPWAPTRGPVPPRPGSDLPPGPATHRSHPSPSKGPDSQRTRSPPLITETLVPWSPVCLLCKGGQAFWDHRVRKLCLPFSCRASQDRLPWQSCAMWFSPGWCLLVWFL